MTKRTFVGGAITALAVALTVGSLTTASNMGFKLNYALSQTQVGVSNSGTSTLALPDNRQTGLNDSKNLMDDIGFANTQNVQRFLEASDTLQSYTGRKGGGTAFPLVAGEGVFVKMSTTVNYIAVGSDDPALVYNLNATQVGVSNSGTNFFAYNYHQTSGDSKQLMDDIGFANTQNVQRFLKASDTLQSYTGRKGGGTAFPLVPGEAYFVKMSTTVNYTPSHY